MVYFSNLILHMKFCVARTVMVQLHLNVVRGSHGGWIKIFFFTNLVDIYHRKTH